MDVAGRVVGDRVVAVLVPDVGEAADAPAFLALLHRLGAAVGVDHEDAVALHVRMAAAEVVEQRRALLEQEEREVEGDQHVDLRGARAAHVLLQQRDAARLIVAQRVEIVAAPPIERIGIEVDADRAVLAMRLHPGCGERGGAAEVFAQRARRAAVDAFVHAAHADDIAFRVLHRFLVERVAVGALGERGSREPASGGLVAPDSTPVRECVRPELHSARSPVGRRAA